MAKDISNLLGNVSLEKSAFDKFGAAVDDSSKLSFGSPQSASTSPQTQSEHNVWNSSNYASALVKPLTAPFQPKLKFMFKVSFKFDPNMIDLAAQMGHDLKALQENITFVVRHVDRPKHDMEYEEVNMYNFRTHVLKSIKNREVGLTIYDDVGNNALSFVNVYRKLLQPIARTELMPSLQHEDFGLNFNSSTSTSNRTVLPGNSKNILTEMRIHQIFVERGSDSNDPSSWVKVVNFVFMNPRFASIDIDDLDHEGANINVVTFSVNFDNVFLDEAKSFTAETGGPSLSIGDIPQDGRGGTSAQGGGGSGGFQGGVDGISTQNFDAPMLAGNFDMPTSPGGGDISAPFGGPLKEAGANTIKNMMNGVKPPITKPSLPSLIDSNAPPSLAKLNTSQFKGFV